MNICIVGSGHVGLVTGACLADIGNKVVCMDDDESKIENLKKGTLPFYEPGLKEIVDRNVEAGRLSFTSNLEYGVKVAQVVFVCVSTPQKPNGELDLSFVEKAGKRIAKVMNRYCVVVEKSTVPVRTGYWLKRTIKLSNSANCDFDLVCNPEFLREGKAVHDFMHPARIVIGTESQRAAEVMIQLYKPLNTPLIVTNIETAELIKHASNAFLALKISYINAIAQICERVGADVTKVAEGIGYDKRIGRDFLDAGIGYGGSCLPKDITTFIRIAEEAGYDFKLLKAVQEINETQKQEVIKKVKEVLGNLGGKTIGILGLSFKPDTDDMRGAPSMDIIRLLQDEGAKVKAYDPKAMDNARRLLRDVEFCRDALETAEGSDALLILTEWEEFKNLKLLRIKDSLKQPIIIDGRNIFEPSEMKRLGFIYRGIGR